MSDYQARELMRALYAAALEREARAPEVLRRIAELPIEPLEREALATFYEQHRAAFVLGVTEGTWANVLRSDPESSPPADSAAPSRK